MKKLFVTILSLLALLSYYIRISQPEQQADRPVLYWQSDPNPQRYDQIELFNQWLLRNGHVDAEGRPMVELKLDSANTQSKLIQAVSGVGGDLMDAPVKVFQPMGVLADLTEAGQALGFGVEKTYPGLENDLKVDGRLYGYPCNVNVVGLWSNVDTFAAYGMEPPPEIWDPETFGRIGREFVARANKGKDRQEIFFSENPSGGWMGERWLATMYRSQGLDDFNETGTRCILDDPRYVEALQYLYDWTFVDNLFPSAAEASSMSAESGFGGGGLSNLQNGIYGMIIIGRWGLIRLRESASPPRLSLSRFPMGSFENMIIGSRNATLYAGGKHPEAASLFFAFLADTEYNQYIVNGADGLPPNPEYALGNPAFERPDAYPNEGDTSAVELKWARTIGLGEPYSKYYKIGGTNWKKYGLDMLMNNKGTAAEAAEEVARRINDAIERNLKSNPDLLPQYEADVALQKKIDSYKAEGRKIPAAWIKNPFYLNYYRSQGMIEE
jgi:multiple sugar transport system substrate-binding protein